MLIMVLPRTCRNTWRPIMPLMPSIMSLFLTIAITFAFLFEGIHHDCCAQLQEFELQSFYISSKHHCEFFNAVNTCIAFLSDFPIADAGYQLSEAGNRKRISQRITP